jgi:hypothetical protein
MPLLKHENKLYHTNKDKCDLFTESLNKYYTISY